MRRLTFLIVLLTFFLLPMLAFAWLPDGTGGWVEHPSGGVFQDTNGDGAFNSGELRIDGDGNVTIGGSDPLQIDTDGDGVKDIETNSGGDLIFVNAGKGVILTNTAGTVSKRVRLNDAGDGLVYEDE